MTRALPARGFSAAMTWRSWGEAFSIRVMSRASARGSPLRARATRPSTSAFRATAGSSDLQDESVALAATAAQAGRADAAAAPAQLVRQVQDEAGARHADRVPQRDRA